MIIWFRVIDLYEKSLLLEGNLYRYWVKVIYGLRILDFGQ
jgi:hypothetical protein